MSKQTTAPAGAATLPHEEIVTNGASAITLRSPWDMGLERVSRIILRERRNLIPHIHALPKDSDRSDRLWRLYTRAGIFMSNGGVGKSFLSGEDVRRGSEVAQRNLGSFNLYRSDRPESTRLDQEQIKQFLADDGLLSADSDRKAISIEFSLGSHEAFTRLLRCIRDDEKNKGLLYPAGGYGLLVRAAATVETGKYEVCLVDANREHGEKIALSSLRKIAERNPLAKTLYLESKTMCGAVYSQDELDEIVQFCKQKDIFLILDAAHANMEFDARGKFPDLVEICQRHDHKKFAVILTGSKTYGLERGRVGFVIFGDKELALRFGREFFKVIGSMGDAPIELANALISSSAEERRKFLAERAEHHKHNMNILIAYVEGIESPNIDEDFRGVVREEIPPEYHCGIAGMKLIYKPESGIQLKVDMSGLGAKYFGNIRMFNSEIFSYALHAATDVVILHSYQLMDERGSAIRLSFSIRDDIHAGMRRMHGFVREALKDAPSPNPYMPDVEYAEDFIFPATAEMDAVVADSRDGVEILEAKSERLSSEYRNRVRSQIPAFYRPSASRDLLDDMVAKASGIVQKKWRSSAKDKLTAAVAEMENDAIGAVVLKDHHLSIAAVDDEVIIAESDAASALVRSFPTSSPITRPSDKLPRFSPIVVPTSEGGRKK